MNCIYGPWPGFNKSYICCLCSPFSNRTIAVRLSFASPNAVCYLLAVDDPEHTACPDWVLADSACRVQTFDTVLLHISLNMAPDINSLSTQSSRPIPNTNPTSQSQQPSPGRSRRTSSVMGPPPLPTHSSLPSSPRPPHSAMMDNSAALAGPIRHPRPLTAAELHLELEKEQESIVCHIATLVS